MSIMLPEGLNDMTDWFPCEFRNLFHSETEFLRSSTLRLLRAGEMLRGVEIDRRSLDDRANLGMLNFIIEGEVDLVEPGR